MSKKAMYDLRNMLCDELDELARKGELGAGDLEIAHMDHLRDQINDMMRDTDDERVKDVLCRAVELMER